MGALIDHLADLPTVSTRRNYQASLFDYCDILFGRQRSGMQVTEEEKERYDKIVDSLIEGYQNGERDYFKDMQKYFATLKNRMTPMAGRNYIACIKTFFLYQRIELSTADWQILRKRLPKGGAQTQESEMSHEVIRSILAHADSRLRALVLVMASSGLRLNEALAIDIRDLALDTDPAEIRIPGANTKTGSARTVFITDEAVSAIREWLKVRDEYIRVAWARTAGFVRQKAVKERPDGDRRLFPFTDQTASLAWKNALAKTGMMERDRSTNRYTLHMHMLRKFFRSHAGLNMPDFITERLMGHEGGYLGASYNRVPWESMKEAYRKAVPGLTIMMKEDYEVREEVKTLKSENKKLRERIEVLETGIKTIEMVLTNPESGKEFVEALWKARSNASPAGIP